MIYKELFTIILSLTVIGAVTEDEIEYYEELITENIEIYNSYVAPTFFEEFQLDDADAEPIEFGEYDFIIVGGGSAGSLLAMRLTEVESWNVLVIEGGARGNNFTDIPVMNRYLLSSKFNWGFKTTSQNTSCPGGSGRQFNLPRGKGLGGTTIINGNVFARGIPSDYDEWGANGLPSWTFENVLPYFKKFENASALNGIDTDYHGFDGPLVVENYKNTSDLSEAFIKSMNSFGYDTVDYSGANPFGVGYVQKSTNSGRRNSGDNAFLRPIQNRTNLKLQTNSLVTKVLISGNITTGVEFISGNKTYRAYASTEVILSAGSYQSAQILLLSGIGPSSKLSKHNITVKLDLPVGNNYKDQYRIIVSGTTNVTSSVTVEESIAEYLRSVGPLTASQGMELVAFYNTSYTPVEYTTLVTNSISLVNGSLTFDAAKSTAFNVFVTFLHPKSVGNLELASADPLQFPLLNPNFLQVEEEVQTLIEGAQFVVKVLENELFDKFNYSIVKDSSCSNFTFNSDDYWNCVVRCSGSGVNHPSGTCKMGVSSEDSVVNERLLVHGMENLRICDASIIPITVTGHMFATAYLIAEKAAGFIKEDHGIS